MSFSGALQGVFLLITLMGLGAFLSWRGLIGAELEDQLSALAIRLLIPCNLFFNAYRYIDAELLRSAWMLLPIPVVTMLTGYGLGALLCRLLNIDRRNRGLVTLMFSLSNAVFIGLPVCTAIFGERALSMVTLYFFGNTLLFWTVGVAGIARDAGKRTAPGWETVRRLLSPPLLATVAGALAGLWAVKLPEFLSTTVQYVGNMNVPVSLFVIGAVVFRMGRSALRFGREQLLTLLGRFLVMPLLTLGACLLFVRSGLAVGLDLGLFIGVFVMESAMPTMNQAMLMARHYGANDGLGAQMLTLSTLVSLAAIPLWTLLLVRVVGHV